MSAERKKQVDELLGVARAHRERGNAPGALAAFEAAAEIDTDNRAIAVELVHELSALERFDEAETRLKDVLAREPRNLPALIEAGRLANRRSRFADAVAAFQAAAAIVPKHVGINIEIARNLRLDSRPSEAEAVLDLLLADDPASIAALLELGHCRRKRGDRPGALAAYEQAGAIEPARPGPKLEAATELAALGRGNDAESVLRELVRSSPKTIAARVQLAYLVLASARVAEAKSLFEDLRDAEPRNPNHTLVLGRIALRRGDRDEALRQFTTATDLAPGHVDARLALVSELRERGRLEEAEVALRAAPPASAAAPGILLELGRTLHARRDHEGARAALDSAAATPQADTTTLVALAREKWALGEPADARRLLERVLLADPDHLSALLTSAEFALLADDPAAALRDSQRALTFHPEDLRPYLVAARAAAAALERDRALAFCGDAHARFGSPPDLVAAEIHILRMFREYSRARDVAAVGRQSPEPTSALWAETIRVAIATGDFIGAEEMLKAPPTPSDEARAHYFKGRIAEARRDPAAAVGSYREALRLRPGQADWQGDLARASLLALDVESAKTSLAASLASGASARLASGQTLNPSQTFVGRLLDEFRLDPETLTGLRNALHHPGPQQIDGLRAIVREHPGNTAAALMLLLALRRTGKFRFAPGRSSRLMLSRIPKRIVQFWDAKTPPEDIRGLMASWDDPARSFRHIVFSDQTAREFLASNASPDVARAFKRASHPAKRADLFRLAYLAREGGIYVDADDRRAASFEALIPKGAAFVGYQEDYGTLANNFVAAIPGHPVIRRALELAVEAVNRGDGDTVWLSTGPGLMTRAFAQIASETGHGSWMERAVVRELHEMVALVGIHCPAAYKRTDLHWSKTGKGRTRGQA